MPSTSPARSLEWLVAAGALFLLTDALDRALHSVSAATARLPLARGILIPFFAAALLLLLRHRREASAAVAAAWPVLLLVVLAAASTLWSTDPEITARWVLGLAGTTIVGVFLAVRFDAAEQLAVVCLTMTVVVIASAAGMILLPEVTTRNTLHGFAWLGVFEENNLFGRAMSLSAVAFFVLARERTRLRRAAVVGGALSAIAVVASRSLTAVLVTGACVIAVAAAVGLGGHGQAPRRRALLLATLGALAVTGLLAYGGDQVVVLLGRDATLSGRTRLWGHVMQMVRERPWLGHGYGTFWPRAQAAATTTADLPRTWPLRHPHNGVLEILFELGVIGVLAFVVPFLVLLRRAFALGTTRGASVWPLAYLLFLALSNIAESALLRHKIFWALYVAVAVRLLSRRGLSYGPPLETVDFRSNALRQAQGERKSSLKSSPIRLPAARSLRAPRSDLCGARLAAAPRGHEVNRPSRSAAALAQAAQRTSVRPRWLGGLRSRLAPLDQAQQMPPSVVGVDAEDVADAFE